MLTRTRGMSSLFCGKKLCLHSFYSRRYWDVRGTGSEGPVLARGGAQRGRAGAILSGVLPASNRKVMRGPGGVTVTRCRASGSLGVPGPPGERCGHVHRTERGGPTCEAERLGVRPHRLALAAGPRWGPRDSGLVVVAASTACCI